MKVTRKSLNFKAVNDAALRRLPDLLAEWFPNGTLVDGKREFAVGNIAGDAGGADGGSFKINLRSGAWGEMNGGEPAGGDIVSLYAHKFCSGDMGAACKELAEKLGIDAAEPANNVVQLPERKAEEWQPMVPPPDTALKPFTQDWKHVYVYRDQAGRVLRYVVRNDAVYDGDTLKKKKMVRPLTYGWLKDKNHPAGKEGWHYRAPDPLRGMYGLERLDGREVLLQEGEGKTDSVQARVPALACLSLTMGTAGKHLNDLTPLAGLTVIMCGDADDGGQKTAEDVALQLLAIGCVVVLVDMEGMPPGWDLGNACSGFMRCKKTGKVIWHEPPWDLEKFESFFRLRGRRYYGKDREPEPDKGPEFDPGFDGGAADDERKYGGADYRQWAPIALGYDGDVFFYLSQLTGQIVTLARGRHVKNELIGLAPLAYWESLEQFQTKEKEVYWTGIADWLKVECAKAGPYDPDRVRGRGAWIDAGRSVLHSGDRLIVDGVEHQGMRLPGSRYVYERKLGMDLPNRPPLTNAEAHKLVDISEALNWERPIFATLFAGWLVAAIICGALKWRPNLWLTGGTGAGKTTIDCQIIRPILDAMHLAMAGGSTEAGIRQMLKSDALAIVFDEAEAEHSAGKQRIQNVLELVRQSTSEGGSRIVKGTQSQLGAKTFSLRSCFLFLSINVSLHHAADENRITVLGLESRKLDQAAYDALMAMIGGTITPDWCAGFLARAVRLVPVIRANAVIFSRAVAAKLGSARIGDQIGTLLACAYSLNSDREITLERAMEIVDARDWEETTSADSEPDECRLLSHLMQCRVRASSGAGWERSIGELVAAAAGKKDDAVPPEAAERELMRHGFKFQPRNIGNATPCGVWIANQHSAIARWLEGTQWASQWSRALKRLPDAATNPKPIHFGVGALARGVFVPVDVPGT